MSKVEVNHLTKSFGSLKVLDDISFQVNDGDFLCIVGPTGCGKTTFLNSLVKLYDIDDGEILINGEEVDLNKHSIAYIMQEYSTMSWLTVKENIQFGMKVRKFSKEKLNRKTEEVLKMVGLEKFADYYPEQLSASMLQRVSIARAFAVEPDLLLMDEPYGQLDLELRFRLEDELLREGSHPRCAVTDDLLSCIDVLVDGRFVAAEKDISLQFRGSRNQRVLDLPKTLAAGQPVIWEKLKK